MLTLDAVTIQLDGFVLRAAFELPPGARVSVIGPSGAGKSTLINAIAGFVPLSAGRLLWKGRDITNDAPSARPVSMLFQDGNLFPHLTVRENVSLGLRPNLRLSRSQLNEVDAALARVGLDGLKDRRPAQLSGGQQSRAALARVLVQHRPLVLLDEPFAALGPALKAEMLDLVAELLADKDATLMMVTHDPADARRLSGSVVLVEGGTAHPPQDTQKLLDAPPPALRAYLG